MFRLTIIPLTALTLFALIPLSFGQSRSERTGPANRTAPGAVVDRADHAAEMRDNARALAAHERQNQPTVEFDAARSAFQAGNRQQAELHLRRAADFLRGSVFPNDQGPEADRVRTAARDIEQLATRLYVGDATANRAGLFDEHYAEAYRALAAYDYAVARRTWERRNELPGRPEATGFGTTSPETPNMNVDTNVPRRTAQYLQASVENMRHWSSESGQPLSEADQAAMNSAQELGARMRQNTDWTSGQIDETLDRYGAALGFGARPSGAPGPAASSPAPPERLVPRSTAPPVPATAAPPFPSAGNPRE